MVPGIQRYRVIGDAFNPFGFGSKSETQVPAFDSHAGVPQCTLKVGPPDSRPVVAVLGINPNRESETFIAQVGHA